MKTTGNALNGGLMKNPIKAILDGINSGIQLVVSMIIFIVCMTTLGALLSILH
jgi:hypothetical protein